MLLIHGNKQARKYQLTINNPKDYSHAVIKDTLLKFKSILYFCMADERGGETQTLHTHVYVVFSSPVRFTTIKRNFPTAHIEAALGTSEENRLYVQKQGKWATSNKAETSIKGSFEEWGELPQEKGAGARSDIYELYQKIKSGATDYELLESNPKNMRLLSYIERTRQAIAKENVKNTFRQLTVSYIFGETGVGKTRYVMESFGYDKVFRVTDYKHPFDNYSGQEILCFDEFSDGVPIRDMLKYLDGYPLELPCRYANRWAAYTQVFILSNSALDEQYKSEQFDHPELWHALLRRLTTVQQFLPDGKKLHYTITDDYNIIPDTDLETGFGCK